MAATRAALGEYWMCQQSQHSATSAATTVAAAAVALTAAADAAAADAAAAIAIAATAFAVGTAACTAEPSAAVAVTAALDLYSISGLVVTSELTLDTDASPDDGARGRHRRRRDPESHRLQSPDHQRGVVRRHPRQD